MTLEDVRDYEKKMQEETNERLRREQLQRQDSTGSSKGDSAATTADTVDTGSTGSGATTPTSKKGWFSWS